MARWSGLRGAIRRLASFGGRPGGLSAEAISILIETARTGERDFPKTIEGRDAVDELLAAGYVEIYQPNPGDTVFTRQGSIQEGIEAQVYASRPRLATTSAGETLARRLSPRIGT